MFSTRTTAILSLAALLAACSAGEETEQSQDWRSLTETPVSFSTYVNNHTTRATYGAIATEQLKASADGFGVFAYYTDNDTYTSATSIPDFFYNQPVRYDAEADLSGATPQGAWVYNPIKYWPNEYGSEAKAQETDRLSFFAYAPYISKEELTPTPTTGITAIKPEDSSTAGDPQLSYTTSDDASKQVDLLWGVVPAGLLPANPATEVQPQASPEEGKPWVDITKQKVNGKLNFNFLHALAWLRLGTVVAAVDEVTPTGEELANKTRIYLRRVEIESPKLLNSGVLNLNNSTASTPEWLSSEFKAIGRTFTSPSSTKSVAFDDGWKDSGLAANNNTVTKASDEQPSLNPALIQKQAGDADGNYFGYGQGVTEIKQQLMREGYEGFFLLPADLSASTDDRITIRVYYDVETSDPALGGYKLTDGTTGSKVQNVIEKTIDGWTALTPGSTYTINLTIGMTSVKFEVESIEGWDCNCEDTVNLPVNVITEWGTAAGWSLSRRSQD